MAGLLSRPGKPRCLDGEGGRNTENHGYGESGVPQILTPQTEQQSGTGCPVKRCILRIVPFGIMFLQRSP